MRHLKTTFAVIGAVAILVLAGNTVALATTGQGFLLGKTNTANTVSTLQRTTDGPALKLTTKSSVSAPLTTNATGKVTHLNADKVDGFDSSSLRNRTYVFTSSFTDKSDVTFNLPVSSGSYLVTVSNFFDSIPAAGIQCYVKSNGVITGWGAQNYVANANWQPAESVTGYAVKSSSSAITVECNTSGGVTWSTNDFPLTITATQTDIIKKAALTPGSGVLLKQHVR